jgi:hypothetical protein
MPLDRNEIEHKYHIAKENLEKVRAVYWEIERRRALTIVSPSWDLACLEALQACKELRQTREDYRRMLEFYDD